MNEVSRRGVLKAGAVAATLGATGIASGPAAHAAAGPGADADGPTLSDDNPMRLWYIRPAAEWLEALPLGNGRLGAMVFGDPHAERMQLNEETVWAGGPHDYFPENDDAPQILEQVRQLIYAEEWKRAQNLVDERFMGVPRRQAQFQPVGDLLLTFPDIGEVSDYHRELDLTEAIGSVSYAVGGVRHFREAFVSHPDQLMVMRLTADRDASVTFDATFDSPQSSTVIALDDRSIALDGVSGDAEGPDGGDPLPGRVRFRAIARARVDGGRVTTEQDGTLRVVGADRVVLLISIGTGYRNFRDVGADQEARAAEPLDKAAGQSYGRLKAAHVRDYSRLFDRVSIDLGTSEAVRLPTDERRGLFPEGQDPQMAALFFQLGRYLLISSSRGSGHPANLQGLWNEQLDPPWKSKYTLNINCQMNYWPTAPGNLLECYQPLFRMIHELAESGARTAMRMYGAPGWVAHHNTDGWRGSAIVDWAYYGTWPCGGAWLCMNFSDHYRYTGDVDTLADNYPVLRGAVEFFLHHLVTDPRFGWLVTNPTNSPEVRHRVQDDESVSLCAGSTMDMQILSDLFAFFDSATRILDVDHEMADRAMAARTRLAPTQIGVEGQIQEWLEDWEPERLMQHRHVSHLYGLFPSSQITPRRTPELAAAARRSLEIRGPGTSGWSRAWRINFWARLLDPDLAYARLETLLSTNLLAPNLFSLHPPFQIDGNFGGMRGITEMLLQSHSGEIALLPALPEAWPEGSVTGLLAEGGFEVDVAWRDHRVTRARITSRIGAPAVVRCAGGVEVRTDRGGPVAVRRRGSDVVAFDTEKGGTYLLS